MKKNRKCQQTDCDNWKMGELPSICDECKELSRVSKFSNPSIVTAQKLIDEIVDKLNKFQLLYCQHDIPPAKLKLVELSDVIGDLEADGYFEQ